MSRKWRGLLISIKQILIKPTKHQEIYIRTENGLKLDMPKIINTDIGFQLMFGYRECQRTEKEKEQKNNNNYKPRTFNDALHYKNHL